MVVNMAAGFEVVGAAAGGDDTRLLSMAHAEAKYRCTQDEIAKE